MSRKIIQLAVATSDDTNDVYALCDDGSVWVLIDNAYTLSPEKAWRRVNTDDVTDMP